MLIRENFFIYLTKYIALLSDYINPKELSHQLSASRH